MSLSIEEVIRGRRTIHQFIPDRIPPDETIMDAIGIANWAPNHHVTEPWRYYLLGPESKEKICRLNADLLRAVRGDKAADLKLQRWMEIPGWLVQTCQISNNPIRAEEDYAACCCAAQNLMLVLWEKGIGCKWTTGGVTRHEDIYRILSVDPGAEKITGLFWYGYPSETPESARKPLEQLFARLP